MHSLWALIPSWLTIAYPTSGTGYIGSFTALALIKAGYDVVIVDNLYNSFEEALNRIALLGGKRPAFAKLDVTDEKALDAVFEKHPEIDSVIHFAALKVCSLPDLSRQQGWLTYWVTIPGGG